MIPGRIPLDGASPDFRSPNIDTNAEPKSHSGLLEKMSEVHVPARNLQKADHDSLILRNTGSLQKESHSIFEDRSVLYEGFSIREYVGKVRSLDIKKCWPFSEGLLVESLKEGRNQLLPPLESPSFRWLACQHSLENAGKHTDYGTLSYRQQILNTESKNNTNKFDKMIDENLTVSLDTHSDEDAAISQILQEQIRKLTTFQISTQEENIATDGKKRMESTEETVNDMGRTILQSSVRFTNGGLEASKCTCKRQKSDVSLQQPEENENRNRECDMTLHKASANQNQVQNFKSDLVQRNSGLLNGLSVLEEETQKTRRVRNKAQDEVLAQVVSRESERNDNLNLEAATEFDSDKHAISDVNNAECSAHKICPVCKTSTSSTITAVNAHMDSYLAQTCKADRKQGKRQKQKSRTRKKRSIVDICAAAPPIQILANYLENAVMNESERSQATGICSQEATTNLNLKKNIISIEAGEESTIVCDFPSNCCKEKEATQACALIEPSSAKGGQTKSLETKRKRQRAPMDVKEPKKSGAPTNGSATNDDDAQHQPKLSWLSVEATNPSVIQQPIMQVNSELHSSIPKSQQQHQFGTFVDHSHSESMLATEHKEKDHISCITPQEEKRDRVHEEEHTAEPSSVVTNADANATSDVCCSDRTEDTLIPQNQLSQSHNEKSYLLTKTEHRHDKAESTECSTLQVEERSKPQDLDSAKLSQNLAYKQSISFNPGNFGETQQLDGTHSEPRCCSIYSLDREKENSKGLLALQKEGSMAENIQAREGHIRNAGLDLNQEVCVIPRDSRGRSISSARMDEEKESDIPFAWSKETQSHKPSIKKNTCAIRDESNFAMNAAFSNGKTGESISMQTFIPAYQDCHIVRNPVAQETLFPCPVDETVSPGRQSLLPTAALSHLDTTSSLNAMNDEKFCMPRDCSDYEYMGLPLDSHGALVKHFPSMRTGANQLHKVPNYMAVNKPLLTEGTKMLQEFNFVETMKTCSNDGRDQWQEYSVSKTNQSGHEETCTKQYFPLHQNEMDRTHFGGSHTRIAGSLTGTPNTVSDLRLCMQITAESGKHGDQRQKTSELEETFPEVHCTRKQHSTSQSIIRLMGQSFTVGGENEGENVLRGSREEKGNMKIAESPSKATVGVSPSVQMTAHIDHCSTRNEDKFYWPESGVNASCRDPRGKTNSLKDLMQPRPSESFARDKDNTFNENASKLVEKRLPTNCAKNIDQSNSAQELIPTSSSPLSAPKLISPVCRLSKNTCVNEWNKMIYMDSYIRDQGCLLQQQTENQLLHSCSGQNRFQNPEGDGWPYISNPSSCTIQSDLVQSLPCTTTSLRSLCGPLHTGVIVHSTSFPTKTLCQTTTSSTSIADYATLIMQGKGLYAPIDASERDKTMLELPNSMKRKRCKTSNVKQRIIDIVDLESKCRDDSRTRECIQETEGLHRKWILQEHENYASGKLSERMGEICKTNDSPVECALDDGIIPKRKMDDGCIRTAESHTGMPLKSQAKENEEFRGLNVKFLESQMRTSRIGTHFSNA